MLYSNIQKNTCGVTGTLLTYVNIGVVKMQSQKALIVAAMTENMDVAVVERMKIAKSFVFNLGSYEESRDVLDPALDFSKQAFEMGIFRLPFDPVFYEFNVQNGKPCTGILAEGDAIILVTNIEPRGIYVMLGKDLENDERAGYSAVVLALTGMLRTKGVPTRHVKPSRQERRAAERKGGFTHEYTVLDLTGVVAEGGSGRGISANRRLHWRRGHFRRLASGKITSVAPCLVGDKAAGFIEHDYTLRC